MIKLTGWRTIAVLAVACGLFLATDAVPKPTTLPKPPAVRPVASPTFALDPLPTWTVDYQPTPPLPTDGLYDGDALATEYPHLIPTNPLPKNEIPNPWEDDVSATDEPDHWSPDDDWWDQWGNDDDEDDSYYHYEDDSWGGGGGGGGAGGFGDPHLTGFDNRKFLLTGDAIHQYNLFSAKNVALNTRMYVNNDKTFFKQFNLVASKDSMRIDMDPAEKTVTVAVNGALLDRQDLVDTGNMSVKTEPVGKANLKVSVSTRTATFTFDTRLYKRPHLDFSLELTRDLRKDEAGGILGHTLHREAGVPHPADMADEEVVARYASRPVAARVAGSSSALAP